MHYRLSRLGAGALACAGGAPRFLIVLAVCLVCVAQPGWGQQEPSALDDFQPRIGVIDFYGLHSVSEEAVRQELGVAEGDLLPRSKNDTELRVERVDGIVRVQLQAVCCEQGGAILYVGIEETGAPHFDYRNPPDDPVLLPEAIHDTYIGFLDALNLAVRNGETAEDLTEGHSLMADAAARDYQKKFLDLAAEHLDVIRDVIRHSLDNEHRAIAAYVIGYAPDKKVVVDDLLYALRDPDDTVRGNAMRSLAAIEVLAKSRPTLGIEIPSTWLIEMLNSIIWTDRSTASVNLVNLTEWRDPETLGQLRSRALDSLIDMAKWHHLQHALPAYILLGRVLGMNEEEIQQAWNSDDRLQLVEKAAELRKE